MADRIGDLARRMTGFTARIIPADEDNGGAIRVTGWQGPGGMQAVAEQ